MVRGERVSRTFATQAEAEAYRQEIADSLSGGITISSESFGAVVAAWLSHVAATKDTRTHDAYSYAVDSFAKIFAMPAGNVRSVHLQTVLDTLDGRKAQVAHDKIRQCLRWAVRMQALPSDPSEAITRPAHDRKTIEVFSADDVKAILTGSAHLRFAAAIRLALSVGLRGGELWALKWSDWTGTELRIQRQASERSGTITLKPPKRNSIRTIALPDSVLEALEIRQSASLREGFAACEWIFPDTRGNVVRRTNFGRRTWHPLLKGLKIRVRGFHHCRHTAASLLLNNGVPITAVARTLGHKDPATTLSIYAHLMTDDLSRHRNRFDAVFSENASA